MIEDDTILAARLRHINELMNESRFFLIHCIVLRTSQKQRHSYHHTENFHSLEKKRRYLLPLSPTLASFVKICELG